MASKVCLHAAVLSLPMTLARPSAAQDCLAGRPTDPAAGWSYGSAEVASFADPGGKVRVWYTPEGAHAPPDTQPDVAELVSQVADDALTFFETELGYRAPVGDGDYAVCDVEGADERLDIYLFDFGSADGTIGLDRCSGGVCSGFVILENDFDAGGYATLDEGVRSVLPHEIFHLVQAAYAESLETWWSEGTAQWATKQLYPELTDLERFLPVFFENTDRPIDLPPAGAAQAFSYATAIFPTFLEEAFEPELVREVFEASSAGAASTAAALDDALARHDSTLAEAFPEFAVWNSATGDAAGNGGYRDAAAYPGVTASNLPATETVTQTETLAGLSAHYYAIAASAARRWELEADPEALGGWFVPSDDGALDVTRSARLPLVTDGPGMLVVAGLRASRRDTAYELTGRPQQDEPGADGGTCALRGRAARNTRVSTLAMFLIFAVACVLRRSQRLISKGNDSW